MNQQEVDCCKKKSVKNKYLLDSTFTSFQLSKNVDNNKFSPKLLFFNEKTIGNIQIIFNDLCKKKSIMSKIKSFCKNLLLHDPRKFPKLHRPQVTNTFGTIHIVYVGTFLGFLDPLSPLHKGPFLYYVRT